MEHLAEQQWHHAAGLPHLLHDAGNKRVSSDDRRELAPDLKDAVSSINALELRRSVHSRGAGQPKQISAARGAAMLSLHKSHRY